VIDVRDDGTGMMTREAWDVIQSLGGYAEVSRSMTGAHVFVKGRISGGVDEREITEELNEGGHFEI
jgi:primase-polymerase (primpol)-like protein